MLDVRDYIIRETLASHLLPTLLPPLYTLKSFLSRMFYGCTATQFENVLKQNSEMSSTINNQTAVIISLEERLRVIQEANADTNYLVEYILEGGDNIFDPI